MNHATTLAYFVLVVLLVQYTFLGALVAHARVALGVPAPATQGPPRFERLMRVHLNTQERLVLMLPLMVLAAQLGQPEVAAAAGAVFAIGRHLYWRGYVSDPARRGVGNVVTMLAVAACLVATLVGLARGWLG